MGIELEWKFALPEALPFADILDWDGIQRRMAETPRLYHMQTSYYDSPDRFLSSRRITLRRRLENERSVICCKAPVPGAADSRLRGEWELDADNLIAALPRLMDLGAPAELADCKELAPLCGAGSAAELALDEGRLFGAERSIPLRELELELKAGAPYAALAFCRLLQARFNLISQEKSKFARAREL